MGDKKLRFEKWVISVLFEWRKFEKTRKSSAKRVRPTGKNTEIVSKWVWEGTKMWIKFAFCKMEYDKTKTENG